MTLDEAINSKRETVTCAVCGKTTLLTEAIRCPICPACKPLPSLDKALSAPKETEAQDRKREEEWMMQERMEEY